MEDVPPQLHCLSNWGIFSVLSESSGRLHTVTFQGSEELPWCDCPAWKFSKGPLWEKTCKHILKAQAEACLWNSEWREARHEVKAFPVTYAFPVAPYISVVRPRVLPGAGCPVCGGPMAEVGVLDSLAAREGRLDSLAAREGRLDA